MVQVPVLPLATPWSEWTHGLYCDDFAESQGKDLETRVSLGGFLPGCGVGTGFRREAIDGLARLHDGGVFSPDCLTEDYDIGLRLFAAGARQRFVPLRQVAGGLVATREYFPRTGTTAIRQRTRWVTGNALQGWERHGWGTNLRRPLVQAWMLWRDRKGLWGNAVSLACNFLLAWGATSWAAHAAAGRAWPLAERLDLTPGLRWILGVNLLFLLARLAVRMTASARVYGWRFALGVAPRLVWGNWINARAALGALRRWAAARWQRTTLGWAKTEHAFPARDALRQHKRPLAEVLASNGYCSQRALEEAARQLPPGASLGEFLLARGEVSEDDLYAAMSLQEGLPVAETEPRHIHPRVVRGLPAWAVRRWNVVPFRVSGGALEVAGPHPPDELAMRSIGGLTRLEVRFFLMKPSVYAPLRHIVSPVGTEQPAAQR
jgi:adsorption protein B